MLKIGVKNKMDLLITITLIEGCTDRLMAEICNTFEGANMALGRLAIVHNAPERGDGYLKTAISVKLDGLECNFRYDMVAYGAEDGGLGHYPDLRQTLLNELRFYAGKKCPRHMKPETYRAFLEIYAKDNKRYKSMLKKVEALNNAKNI